MISCSKLFLDGVERIHRTKLERDPIIITVRFNLGGCGVDPDERAFQEQRIQ